MKKFLLLCSLVLIVAAVAFGHFRACVVSASGATAAAATQGKIAAQWHCPADTVNQKLEVGDVPEHSYAISQGTCSLAAKEGALPEKSATITEFDETWKSSYKFQGRANVTLLDGEKIFYAYGGNAPDSSKPPVESWNIDGGTGKYKAIQGSGSCAGKANPDGSSDWNCSGTYSLGE
jgi:hypothetical protein